MVWIYLAAIGAVGVGVTHSALGERYVFPRLFRCEDLPLLRRSRDYTKSILRWAWHLLSVSWFGFAFILFLIALDRAPNAVELSRIIAGVFGLTCVIAIVTTRGRHVAWPLLALVALASWFGV
jgi:hypothetical protein